MHHKKAPQSGIGWSLLPFVLLAVLVPEHRVPAGEVDLPAVDEELAALLVVETEE